MQLSRKIKLELYKALIKEPDLFGTDNYDGIIDFMNEIWDLSSMPSQDSRYDDALGDFIQHLIRNNDYSYDDVFLERLKLLDDDNTFTLFVETTVLPKFRSSEDDILKYFFIINPYLQKEGYTMYVKNYDDDGYPVYKTQEIKAENLPVDIPANDITFHVEKDPYAEFQPPFTPSFYLKYHEWDDYSVNSTYDLYYCEDLRRFHKIGRVKIIYNNEYDTNQYIPDSFVKLGDNFCSLGQKIDYYSELRNLFKRNFISILFALRDAAFFPEIQDNFDQNHNFRMSLIRYDSAERLLREARFRLYNYDLSNLYSFIYQFKPAFSKDFIDIKFEFSNEEQVSNRIYALIGKNGTGKTQLITSLPLMISEKKDQFFTPKPPLFSKIIAVSYSLFDRFKIPKKTSSFNYHYCGIKKDGDEKFTEQGLVLRFHNTWKRIESIGRIDKWRKILLTFIDSDLIDLFLVLREETEGVSRSNRYKVDIKKFGEVKDKLSSGQAIILYIITEIVANIRYDSLLLYDEPETHLHPNAITQLMNTIYELVEEFRSYCIIATHSPLVVRELFSKNVFVLTREDSNLTVRRIQLESFGENLSILTEEIFGNKGIPKQHKRILEELVESEKSYEEIIGQLEFDQIPLSLNVRLILKSLINNRDANKNI